MLRGICTFRKEYAVGFLLLLAISIIWLWAFNTHSFWKTDALDYAQMGRELGSGKGLSTLHIFPRHIRLFSEKGYLEKENWPNLYRYPLPIILDAFFYKITANISMAAVLQSGAAFLLSIPVLFILATRLTNLKVGIISTIFYVADPVVFTGSYQGMSESLAILWILSLFLIVFSGEMSKPKYLAMGVICGLAYLTRTQLIFLVPLVVLYVWIQVQKKARLSGLALFSIAFVFTIGPWFVRNAALVGDPAFSFSTSRNLVKGSCPVNSDLDLQLDAPVKTLEVLKSYGPGVARKTFKNILMATRLSFWGRNFSPKGSIFIFFLFASVIYRWCSGESRYDSFRRAVVVLVFGNLLIVSLAFHNPRFHTPVIPLIYIVGINEILVLFGDLGFSRSMKLKHIAVWGLLLFGIVRLWNATMIEKNRPSPLSADDKKSYEIIRQVAGDDTIIASSVSHKIACYAGCRSLRLPVFERDLLKINESFLPIDYVLINRNILDSDSKRYASYSKFIKSDEFLKTFEFAQELPDGAVLFKRL